MKNLKYIALTAFIVFLIGIIGTVLMGPTSFSTASAEVLEEKTFDGSGLKNIDINTGVMDVEIVKGESDEVSVSMEGKVSKHLKDNFILKTALDGDTLKANIETRKKNWVVGFNIVDVNLKITVPQKVYEQIHIKTATGDVALDAFEADSLEVDSSTGDIQLDGFNGETLSLETSTGDMFLESVSAEMELKSSTGDIEVHDSEGKLTVNSNTGDVNVKLTNVGKDVDIETSTGDIEVLVKKIPENISVDLRASTGDTVADISDLNYERRAEHEVEAHKGNGGPKVYLRSSTGDINLLEY